MRLGYYLAGLRQRIGDPEFAAASLLAWRSLHHRKPSRCDGVAIYEANGATTVLVVRSRIPDAYRGDCEGACKHSCFWCARPKA